MDEHGNIIESKTFPTEWFNNCKFRIMVSEHYREDGTCKCDDPEEQAMMIREWEYEASDFPTTN
jgi:hypothetical protein